MFPDHGPWSPRVDAILHGGDYNPEQWLHEPKVLEEDLRLMRLAGCNAFSVNIFGWAACEPAEGRFDFGWLDRVIEGLHGIGAKIILATPSASKPAWLDAAHPSARRLRRDGRRLDHGGRHNHCPSDPWFRAKTRDVARRLAERYGRHPALVCWHVNNELNGGECHCPHCYEGFRAWLKARYGGLEALNTAWWNRFWSHDYTDWAQVEPRDPENLAQELDWRRYLTHANLEQFRHEAEPLRALSPGIPVTTNLMGPFFGGLDYWKLAEACDIASWDSYPAWARGDDAATAMRAAFCHDATRSLKRGKPWLLMESTPSNVNWADVCKLKEPGQHRSASLQALARGSESVLYFQWRKGQGGYEQHHGAVVDHEGSERTRVFKEVAALGAELPRLKPVLGSGVLAQAALFWDWENRWALELAKGMRNHDRGPELEAEALAYYRALWRRGIAVDLVGLGSSLAGYKLLLAPWLYMVTPAFAQELRAFVRGGGVLVTGVLAGCVDASGLCHRGGRPGLLRDVFGIWAEELDTLDAGVDPGLQALAGAPGLKGAYRVGAYAEVLHLEGAQALARFRRGWMKGKPALTGHRFGQGSAYYLATRPEAPCLEAFLGALAKGLALPQALPTAGRSLPEGVEASLRGKGPERFLFLINHLSRPRSLGLGQVQGLDLLSGKAVKARLSLAPYGAAVLHWREKA